MKTIITQKAIEPLFESAHHLESLHRVMKELPLVDEISLPLLKLEPNGEDSRLISLFFLCMDHAHVGKFIQEMMTRWLLPSKLLPISLFFMAPFRTMSSNSLFMAGEIQLQLEKPADVWVAQRQFDLLKFELDLGLRSPYSAARILEMKAFSLDEKRMLIQDRVTQMIRRFPARYDYDIFSLMQHFFLSVNAQYLRCREVRQFAENLAFFYLIRKKIISQIEKVPERRHVFVKVVRRRLHLPLGIKPVLGVLVGVNFLRENEKFEKKHLLQAVQSLVPSLALMEESALTYKDPEHALHLLYLEFEKKDGDRCLAEEMALLQEELQPRIKGRVERLHRPVFMPRNEEEVLRHVVTLGRELRYLKDRPQVIISFEKQTDDQLVFTVIVVRLLFADSPSLSELEGELGQKARLERVKTIGKLRKKYPKEALVLKVELPLMSFLREDHSVDLYQARHKILMDLEKVMGEVRDYNGGIISKQNEAFRALAVSLGEKGQQHRLLLENFFHGIYPIERRSFIKTESLKALFLLLLETLDAASQGQIKTIEDEGSLLILIEFADSSSKAQISELVEKLGLPPAELLSLQLEFEERGFLGYLYFSEEKEKRKHLAEAFKEVLKQEFSVPSKSHSRYS